MTAPNRIQPGGEDGAGDRSRRGRASQIPFGALLKRHRGAAGISQEELAARAGVGVRTISDLERGVARWPYPSTVTLLAEALQVDEAQRAALEAAARRPAEVNDRPYHVLPETPPDRGPSAYLTLLPGRERDEAATRHAPRRGDARLAPLTGTGGEDKARLAVQVVASHTALFPVGLVFMPLTTLAEPALAPETFVHVIGLEQAAAPSRVNGLGSATPRRRAVTRWGWHGAGRVRWYRRRVRP